LLFEVGDFVSHDLRFVHRFGVGFVGFLIGRILLNDDAGVSKKFLEERVHRFEAVGIARVIAEQNVMFEEIGIVFSALEKNQAVLEQIIEGREFFAEESLAGLGD